MTSRISSLLQFIRDKKHHEYRQDKTLAPAGEFKLGNLSFIKRSAKRLIMVLEAEKPVILPDEQIVLMRTIRQIPEIYTDEEWRQLNEQFFIFEGAKVCNINSDYETTLRAGLLERRSEIENAMQIHSGNAERLEFLQCVSEIIDAIFKFCDKYAAECDRAGRSETARIFREVPRDGAKTFIEALQFFRILHFCLWASKNHHNTIGRFDQYMYPYFKADIEAGRLNMDSALELLEDFFISFNKDSDLYPGVQQGDNGQSMVLGGVNEHGECVCNELSELCLRASLELSLIDPKINLRVGKDTPASLYELGTELTKEGLGFPQYENDDVIIPGLVAKGYDLEDARNYVVAACWEYIVPKYGMDIPNIGALSFVKAVNRAVDQNLDKAANFNSLMDMVKKEITIEIDRITESVKNMFTEPAPFQSLLMADCVKNGKDISKGNKYNNYGIHGTGIATAADSLAAIKKYVFDDKSVPAKELMQAVASNFEGYDELRNKLKYDAPKMGNDDDYADDIAVELLNAFAGSLEGRRNERGGVYRAGSGSAMYYIWHANEVGASADGRKKGEPLAANFSPSLNARLKGPISIMKSFSKPDLKRIINGGPLTIEIHDTVFRNAESKAKVAALVKTYMDLGGQQLQLNAVNADRLIDAQRHPENYKNLIVRVWGWSGYFVELDKEFQDHIIQRVELAV